MIRPVLYVDLPGIIYAINQARSNQYELANFVCWLEPEENVLPSSPILRNILPLHPATRTWICEDHWRMLGFAQVRRASCSHYLGSLLSGFDDKYSFIQ